MKWIQSKDFFYAVILLSAYAFACKILPVPESSVSVNKGEECEQADRFPAQVKEISQSSLPETIEIPAFKWPKPLYSASPETISKYLATQIYTRFFIELSPQFQSVHVKKPDNSEYTLISNGTGLPWHLLAPGEYTFQLDAGPIRHLRVTMDPPKIDQVAKNGRLSWTPILFASSYEVMSTGENVFKKYSSQSWIPVSRLPTETLLRVRALEKDQTPISDWSDPVLLPHRSLPLAKSIQQKPTFQPEKTKTPDREVAMVNESVVPESLSLQPTPANSAYGWVLIGSGTGISYLNQKISGHGTFSSVEAPGLGPAIEAGYVSARNFGADFTFRQETSQTKVQGATIDNATSSWSNMSGHFVYRTNKDSEIESSFSLWKAGFRSEQIPFLSNSSPTTLLNHRLKRQSLDLEYDYYRPRGQWMYVSTIGYEYPYLFSVTDSNSSSGKSPGTLNGALRIYYRFRNRINAGGGVGLQYSNQTVEFSDSYGSTSNSDMLLRSTMDLRFGFDF